MVRIVLAGVVACGLLLGSAGCIAVGGTSNRPTRGQELIDLKAALDRGAINEGEYETTKSQIMSKS